MSATEQQEDRPIGIRQVMLMTSYSKPTIWRRIRAGKFPAPRFKETGAKGQVSTVRWSYNDVRGWVDTKLGKPQSHEPERAAA